jgi:hypothetical protein
MTRDFSIERHQSNQLPQDIYSDSPTFLAGILQLFSATAPAVTQSRALRKIEMESEKLCGTAHFSRVRRAKSKIPVVAMLASERTNEKKRAHHSLHHAAFPGPAHRLTVALRTDVVLPKTETHKARPSVPRGASIVPPRFAAGNTLNAVYAEAHL